MRFVFEQAKLWKYVEETGVASPLFETKQDNNEDQIEKIYAREKKIIEFQDIACKAIAKMGKMYTDNIQKKFLLIKVLSKWTSKNLWDHLESQYTYKTGSLNRKHWINSTKFGVGTARILKTL